MNQKNNSERLLEIIRDSFELMLSLKFKIIFISIILLISGIIAYNTNLENSIFGKAIESLETYAENLKDKSFFDVFSFIFLNNARVAATIIILSVIPFAQVFLIATNGIIIGTVLNIKSSEHNPIGMLISLIPHGIFEIPAIILAGAIGLYVSMSILGLNNIHQKDRKKISAEKKENRTIKITNKISNEIKKIFIIYVTVIIPLLLVAAIIESIAFIIGR